jgi:DnaJ family protein C protein 28
MNIIERIAEEKIREAMQVGVFDNLPGKGKPLKLDENPYEDPDRRLAHHLLRSQGFTLPWIAMRLEIQADIDRLRRDMAAEAAEADTAAADAAAAGQDQVTARFTGRFTGRIKALNRRIFVYNLHAPSPAFHLLSLGEQ